MAFVVVTHQAAKHISLLPELLDKCTKMRVAAVEERMPIQPNHVYIAPPGKKVDLLAGTLHLSDLPEKHVAPLPIDHFFRSLAAERREKAVAIILSGTGSDGTLGLSAIKGESGMVMVQSAESAKFSGMPQHAIDAGRVDYVLPPDKMPKQLIAYARGPFLKSPLSAEKPTTALQQTLPEILLKLRRHCGHDFSGYKTSTICRRIERRMNIHQINQPQQYLSFLDEHRPEAETLFRELLIGVTSFFRDPWAFEALASEAIMPLLSEQSDDASFRVWVPGCSTGEEAYSIAIMLRECMDKLKIRRNVQIFATDLDDHAIEAARAGLFPSGICADVSAQRLGKYFTKEDGRYRIRRELRDWLVFAPQNVIHDPPFTKLHLISCRNLLIYIQAKLQEKLLMLFYYSLLPGACLFLGTSEIISGFDDLFESVDSKAKVFRRKNASSSRDRQLQFPVTVKLEDKADRSVPTQDLTARTLRDSVTNMLATVFAPPTVVVSERGEIVHVHGRTGMFLELAPGGPPNNILSMARKGLELPLSSALRQAALQDTPVVHEHLTVSSNGDTVVINLIVQRIVEPQAFRGLLRVSFQMVASAEPVVAVAESVTEERPTGAPRSGSQLRELQLDLQRTRELLQRSIEERDASHEEMRSTNEELQSANEELQSTNEELETSKEELQSLNEELQTVNAEFQDKIRELSTANDDMTNLLNGTNIGTIFLDSGMHIKRYTEQAKRIVRLIPTDLGRSLLDLTSHLRYENLAMDGQEVLKTLIPKECEVQTDDGRWLLMRIMPYRTFDDKIDGLVMTFVDIDESKRLREEALVLTENIVATVREPLLALDSDLRVCFANRAFYDMFSIVAEDTVGRMIYELENRMWDIPALRRRLEGILPQNSSFENFEVTQDFPQLGHRRMLLNARSITTASERSSLILLAIEVLKTGEK